MEDFARGSSEYLLARCKAVFGAAFASFLLVGISQALASAGCTAVNGGGLNDTVSGGASDNKTITNFAVGDAVTFTITISGSPGFALWGLDNGNNINAVPATTVSKTLTYTVTGINNDTTLKVVSLTAGFPLFSEVVTTATCTPAAAASTSTDSQKLQSLETIVTETVSAISGQAISGAVGGAIGDAFSNSGSPFTAGPNGFSLNFTAAPQPDPRTQEAFDALAYAAGSHMATKAPPPPVFAPDWSAWADLRGTGFDSNGAAGTNGNQLNLTGGVGRKITPDFLVGLFTGYEDFNFTVNSLTGKMTGDGGTIGAYAAYRFSQTWRADGLIGWSDMFYNGVAGTAAGSFTGSRWLASGDFTGTYHVAAWIIEPSAQIYTLWENDSAFTDSLGTAQPSRSFSDGRIATGAKASYPFEISGVRYSPYAGLYGDWRFATNNALPVNVADTGLKDGWSARVTSGVIMTARNGASLALGGELGGLGGGYEAWSANARVNWPF